MLFADGVQLVTKIRRNMKNKLMPVWEKLLLRKRAIIESVNDQLKNISQIEVRSGGAIMECGFNSRYESLPS